MTERDDRAVRQVAAMLEELITGLSEEGFMQVCREVVEAVREADRAGEGGS